MVYLNTYLIVTTLSKARPEPQGVGRGRCVSLQASLLLPPYPRPKHSQILLDLDSRGGVFSSRKRVVKRALI